MSAISVVVETNLPNLLYRGKVRDTYDLGEGLMLIVATDRISAFDVVLPTPVPEKGVILCKMSAFWFHKTAHIIPNHLISLAENAETVKGIKSFDLIDSLPADIAKRGMVVKRAKRVDVECIARGYIAGSAWSEYKKSGTVSGVKMPAGLKEGEKLSEPIFTPSTKAEQGHDENISLQQMRDMVGSELTNKLQEKTVDVYGFAHDYALKRGIIISDTKMEFGILNGNVILIDELLTPDSSRFWDAKLYKPGQSQPNFDKQFVRDWLTDSGWNKEPPAPALPGDIVEKTRKRYLEAYKKLTGHSI